MKKIRYLSVEEVGWFHGRILQVSGGEPEQLAKANLEFVLERVREVGEGLGGDEAIVKKAAFLLRSLIVQHPFINGNKRTAFEVADAFLELNGYRLRTATEEAYRFLADIGAGTASQSQTEEWIATNLAKKTRRSRVER